MSDHLCLGHTSQDLPVYSVGIPTHRRQHPPVLTNAIASSYAQSTHPVRSTEKTTTHGWLYPSMGGYGSTLSYRLRRYDK